MEIETLIEGGRLFFIQRIIKTMHVSLIEMVFTAFLGSTITLSSLLDRLIAC